MLEQKIEENKKLLERVNTITKEKNLLEKKVFRYFNKEKYISYTQFIKLINIILNIRKQIKIINILI